MPQRARTRTAFVYALLAAVAVVPQGCSKVQQAVTGNSAQDPVRLFGEAETFRLMATADLLRALAVYGTPQANLRFAALGDAMFPDGDWQGNWRLFLSTALPNIGKAADGTPLVGYYHPWSDTMLLTRWSRGSDGKLTIVAVDAMPGVTVRGKTGDFTLGRAWQRGEVFAPEAVARLTAETALAFERANDPLAGIDAETAALLPAMAGTAFVDYRGEVDPLFASGNTAGEAITIWIEARDGAIAGKTLGEGAIAEGVAMIGKLDPRVRDSLTPVSYLATDKSALLMLASKLQPNLFVVLQTEETESGPDLRRLNLVSFQSFYDAARKEKN